MPPAVKRTTAACPARDLGNQFVGCLQFLRCHVQLVGRYRREAPDLATNLAHVGDGIRDIAGASLTLGADHGRSFSDPPQRLAKVGGPAHERHREPPLVNVVGIVGGVSTSDSSM
jgi:hypothetical protein